jgi:Ca2+-binding RTX toxin-like protein
LTTAQVTGDGADPISGVENLTGNTLSNVLVARINNDSLTGNGGSNLLSGGLGNDTLDGAGGADYAIFAGSTGATVNLGLHSTGHRLWHRYLAQY